MGDQTHQCFHQSNSGLSTSNTTTVNTAESPGGSALGGLRRLHHGSSGPWANKHHGNGGGCGRDAKDRCVFRCTLYKGGAEVRHKGASNLEVSQQRRANLNMGGWRSTCTYTVRIPPYLALSLAASNATIPTKGDKRFHSAKCRPLCSVIVHHFY